MRREATERPKLAPGNYLRITVEDTGCGMPEEMIDKVFDPYFSTKQRGSQKGMGLGLSVSHSIIKLHGGSIKVASTVGQGSRFQVDLPTSPVCLSAGEAARALALMSPCRMLLVEDEAWIRVAMGESLRTMGHEVDLIDREGLAREIFAAAQHAGRPYHLVILNLAKSGRDEATASLEAFRQMNPSVRVVAVVGRVQNPMVHGFARPGFDAVLVRPFDFAALRDAIVEALNPEMTAAQSPPSDTR